MKQEAQPTAAEVHEALYDGADTPVEFSNGNRGVVKVRKIARPDFATLAVLMEDDSEEGELREAAFYCGLDETWARQLTELSLDRVLAEGQRLNFSRYARWFRRRARLPQLVNGQEALVQAALEAVSRLTPRESTNGSSARDTATPSSGVTRPTS